MATGAAPDGFFRHVYEGCLSGGDMGIERRPYHRNCKCALHKSKHNGAQGMSKCGNVSYPIRRAWSEGCLALAAAASGHSTPSSSPSFQAVGGRTSQVGFFIEEEEAGQGSPLKVGFVGGN